MARPDRRIIAALALAGLLLTSGAVALVLSNAPADSQAGAAMLHGASVAAPMAVGLAALLRGATQRFAWLLVGASACFAMLALAESRDPEAYAVGRSAVWVVELVLAYLLLSFPSGTLVGRAERIVLGVLAAVVALLFLPTVLLATDFPVPSPWATCSNDCPANPFALVDATPAFVTDVMIPLREVLTPLIYLAVAALLLRHARRGGPLLRAALQVVVAVAVFRALTLGAYFAARAADDVGTAVDVLGWVWAMGLPLVALSFGAGLVNRRLHAAEAFKNLAFDLRRRTATSEVRDALARALEDPTLRLLTCIDGDQPRWVDERGAPTEAPRAGGSRSVTVVRAEDRSLAGAVVHDTVLGQDPSVVEAAATYAFVGIENGRLIDEVRTAVDELEDSRLRVIENGDAVRRDIERDLHDGAQQRLSALRMRIEMAAEQVEAVSPEAAASLAELGGDVDATIDEVRRLARGIYPSLLADQGLAPALRAAARGSPVAASVHTQGLERLRPDLERAVYFACIEALQNAVTHATGATSVAITVVVRDGRVLFEVRDDGAGFDVAAARAGAGLANLVDRLASVGGDLTIQSPDDGGTRVAGWAPVAADDA